MCKIVPLYSPSYQTSLWIGTIRTSSLLGACSGRVVHFPRWWYLVGVALSWKVVEGTRILILEWAGVYTKILCMRYIHGRLRY